MTKLSKITKLPPLREQVSEQIHRAILSGEISVGERLTEDKLANLLGVSRTPIREAMTMLAQVGVLRYREAGGYEVFVPTVEEVSEMYEIRSLLEPFGIQSVAISATKEHVTALKNIIKEEIEAHKAGDASEFALKSFSFRVKLYETCENSMIRKVSEQFIQYLNYIAIVTLQEPDNRQIVIDGQRGIVAALEKNDKADAKKATETYLKAANSALTKAAATASMKS